jgi:hypothetical protein
VRAKPSYPVRSLASMDDVDRSILDLEARWFRRSGAKAQAIAELGLSPTGYYQRLVRILNDPTPEAAAEFGPLIARLTRLRDARVGQRAARPAA